MSKLSKRQISAKKSWETRRKRLEKSAEPTLLWEPTNDDYDLPTALETEPITQVPATVPLPLIALDSEGVQHARFHSYDVTISNEQDEVLGVCVVQAQTKYEAIKAAKEKLVFTASHNKY